MDSKEAEAYLATAETQLEDAEMAFNGGSHSLCVFLSASCAENASAAMLTTLGAKPSRKHRNSLVIYRLAQDATPEMRAELMELVNEMKSLEPHVTKARYPILSGQDLLPPSEYYTRKMAQELLTRARRVLPKARTIIDSALH